MLVFSGTENQWKGEVINEIRHPKNIEHLWSDAQLANIGLEKYVLPMVEPQPIDPLTMPISRMQFKATLRIHNLLEVVKTAIEAIPDPVEQAVAMSKFEENNVYHRNDPLFSTLGGVLGLTEEQIDGMWLQAREIK